jgi:methionine biosynthesis protein MetW
MSFVKFENNGIRFDLQLIGSWIEPGSKVLDLGCGEGELLYFLKTHKGVKGKGIEKEEGKVARCIAKGLSVMQGDINEEVLDFPDQHFDYVILSRTLQQVYEPAQLLLSILRIGRRGIVSFPNFSHWLVRWQLLTTGHAPVTSQLPYQWHDTPNIRVITIKDFQRFSREVGFEITRWTAIKTDPREQRGLMVSCWPNLRAAYGIFQIQK